jgi:hypothetical protein
MTLDELVEALAAVVARVRRLEARERDDAARIYQLETRTSRRVRRETPVPDPAADPLDALRAPSEADWGPGQDEIMELLGGGGDPDDR